MPKLPRVSGADVVRALQRLGFYFARQRGSHVILKKDTSTGTIGATSGARHRYVIRYSAPSARQ